MKSELPLFFTTLECLDNLGFKSIKKELATDFILRMKLHPVYTIEVVNNHEQVQKQIIKAMNDVEKYAIKRLNKLRKDM